MYVEQLLFDKWYNYQTFFLNFLNIFLRTPIKKFLLDCVISGEDDFLDEKIAMIVATDNPYLPLINDE